MCGPQSATKVINRYGKRWTVACGEGIGPENEMMSAKSIAAEAVLSETDRERRLSGIGISVEEGPARSKSREDGLSLSFAFVCRD